eukprot:359260-Chlamydomonas_euryale.AAC.3
MAGLPASASAVSSAVGCLEAPRRRRHGLWLGCAGGARARGSPLLPACRVCSGADLAGVGVAAAGAVRAATPWSRAPASRQRGLPPRCACAGCLQALIIRRWTHIYDGLLRLRRPGAGWVCGARCAWSWGGGRNRACRARRVNTPAPHTRRVPMVQCAPVSPPALPITGSAARWAAARSGRRMRSARACRSAQPIARGINSCIRSTACSPAQFLCSLLSPALPALACPWQPDTRPSSPAMLRSAGLLALLRGALLSAPAAGARLAAPSALPSLRPESDGWQRRAAALHLAAAATAAWRTAAARGVSTTSSSVSAVAPGGKDGSGGGGGEGEGEGDQAETGSGITLSSGCRAGHAASQTRHAANPYTATDAMQAITPCS